MYSTHLDFDSNIRRTEKSCREIKINILETVKFCQVYPKERLVTMRLAMKESLFVKPWDGTYQA